MGRREQREHIFKLLFMTQFNSKEEMPQQLSLYFESLEDLKEEDQAYMEEKYQHVLEHLKEIDQILNEHSHGWKTKRMSRVDLTALRLAVYELKYDPGRAGRRGHQRSRRTGQAPLAEKPPALS